MSDNEADNASDDIQPVTDVITMHDGVTSVRLDISPIRDSLPEVCVTHPVLSVHYIYLYACDIYQVSELFYITLTSVSGGARLLNSERKKLIIQDSDAAHGEVQWKLSAHQLVTVCRKLSHISLSSRCNGHFLFTQLRLSLRVRRRDI